MWTHGKISADIHHDVQRKMEESEGKIIGYVFIPGSVIYNYLNTTLTWFSCFIILYHHIYFDHRNYFKFQKFCLFLYAHFATALSECLCNLGNQSNWVIFAVLVFWCFDELCFGKRKPSCTKKYFWNYMDKIENGYLCSTWMYSLLM